MICLDKSERAWSVRTQKGRDETAAKTLLRFPVRIGTLGSISSLKA